MTGKVNIKTRMWKILTARGAVTYDDLQELTGASRVYAQEWMATLVKRGVVKKLSDGRYRIVDMDGNGRKPSGETLAIHSLPDGYQQHEPEMVLWAEILKLKKFSADELIEKKLANETTTRQYVALLRRAGILSGERVKNKKNRPGSPMVYRLTGKAGPMAPLMGRCFYIFDPNSGDYTTTDLEKFNENGPGGAGTPEPRPTTQQ